MAKTAVKLLADAINHRPLTKAEFVTVRDYLLVRAMYENASRPGPLENAKLARFKQAEYTESKWRWTIIIDAHKTTRHQGPVETTMDEGLFGYTRLYMEYVSPCFVVSGVKNIFIKDDFQPFRKGTIGRRVAEVFKRAGLRHDVRVTATKIRKLFSSSAAQMSPSKKPAINTHTKHKESTADNNYVIKLNTELASAAHEQMHTIIDEKGQPEAGTIIACSRLSVNGDNRKSGRATSGVW